VPRNDAGAPKGRVGFESLDAHLFSHVLGSIGSVEHILDAGSTITYNLHDKYQVLPPCISISADCAEGSAWGVDAQRA